MPNRFKAVIVNSAHPYFDVEKEILSDIADVSMVWCNTSKELVESVSDADALMVADIAHIPLTREIVEQLKKVKIISIYGVGTDAVDVSAATEHGIIVANVPDYGISEVSDHTMALMLSLLRRVTMLDKALKKLGWEKTRSNMGYVRETFGEFRRLGSMSLGLLGFGVIGRAVAEKAKGFGFHITAYDPYVPQDVFAKTSVEKVGKERLLKESDIISIHVLLTKETRHMIGEQEFSRMKRGVFIVNTSRGAVIDEKALIRALEERQVAGAALDVFEREPLEKSSSLLQMNNVIVTPHIAWYSEEALLDQKMKAGLNVKKALSGEPPLYPVNLRRRS